MCCNYDAVIAMIRNNRIQVLIDDDLREWLERARGDETESTFVYTILKKEKEEDEKTERTSECNNIAAVSTAT
jgi:hypothetical protein